MSLQSSGIERIDPSTTSSTTRSLTIVTGVRGDNDVLAFFPPCGARGLISMESGRSPSRSAFLTRDTALLE